VKEREAKVPIHETEVRLDEQAQLRSMLHQWDPTNVEEDRGKYDSLIAPVLTRLSKGATVASLAEYLWFEVRDHLGIDPARSRPDLMAEWLVAWYHARTR
jgi:hypothetical protein